MASWRLGPTFRKRDVYGVVKPSYTHLATVDSNNPSTNSGNESKSTAVSDHDKTNETNKNITTSSPTRHDDFGDRLVEIVGEVPEYRKDGESGEEAREAVHYDNDERIPAVSVSDTLYAKQTYAAFVHYSCKFRLSSETAGIRLPANKNMTLLYAVYATPTYVSSKIYTYCQ